MIQSYLKTAVRPLWKHRGTTAINGIGLAVGLAVALLVLLFVRQQLRTDRFHSDSEKIHRVTAQVQSEGYHHATAPQPLPTALRESVSGLDAVASLDPDEESFIVDENESLTVETIETSDAF
ncbi:hypothetical protein [Salinibacter altiplanensis]|uniref:hypothetical protein n=1 Tax=Salinibacter altiplanensis TaxID=1803181 RepID=UPI000C9EEAC9|nr:hypothetical protein [Salinibacter altiplanensis]